MGVAGWAWSSDKLLLLAEVCCAVLYLSNLEQGREEGEMREEEGDGQLTVL